MSDIEYIGPEKREFGGKAGGVKFHIPEFTDEKTPRLVTFAAPAPSGEAELLGLATFRKARPARADKSVEPKKD